MYKFVFRRLLMMIPVLFGITFVIFTMSYLTPGDPARAILGEMATEAEVLQLHEQLGLDDPYLIRFGRYIRDVVTKGDFGISYTTKRSVIVEVLERLPTTLLLSALSVIIAIAIGIPIGILSATKQYSIFDNVGAIVALLGVSMPTFWLGLMLIVFFSVHLGWLPSSGFYGPQYWVLPAFALGAREAASVMRMTRSSMLEVIRQDYIRTARAKGHAEKNVIMKHALKNALMPIITVVGLTFGQLLGNAVLTESIFTIPGLGRLMVDAIKARNFPVVQGGVLLLAAMFSFVNLGVDVLYAFVDPRIKSQYKRARKGN